MLVGMARRPVRLLPILLVVLTILWGCASRAPAPPRERVVLKTNSVTRYYSVQGMTTRAIFAEIEKNGLIDSKAHRAVGLTSADWSMDWKGLEKQRGICDPRMMTITLDLIVTLPQHKRSSDLPPDLASNWRRFAAGVATHEQRHVDIYLSGAKRVKSRMETMLARTASCAELEKAIRGLWTGQQAEIEKAQDQFHAEEDAKSQDDRKPLQAQIVINQNRLTALGAELKTVDQTLDTLRRKSEATQAEIKTVLAEMSKAGTSPPSCAQSGLSRRIHGLCQQHVALVAAYNALVEQHNSAVTRRNTVVDEHNRVVTTTNTLLEALNWTR
jgi:predicted secreted Zn-dependent protease